jgi:hypothetical protein
LKLRNNSPDHCRSAKALNTGSAGLAGQFTPTGKSSLAAVSKSQIRSRSVRDVFEPITRLFALASVNASKLNRLREFALKYRERAQLMVARAIEESTEFGAN